MKISEFRYKNILLLSIGIIIAIILVITHQVSLIAEKLGEWGYLGSFLLGIMFSSSLTVGIATVLLFGLGKELNPFLVAILGGLGAMAGDFLFYHFLKKKLFEELKELFSKINFFPKKQLVNLFANEYFAWFIPSIAYVIILSPIPDEVGVGLLSTIKYSARKLLIITFVLNTIGIFIIVFLSRII